MTVKLKLPPGMYKNGTPYSGAGRYIDGNLIRWVDGVARPIGGWQRRVDPLTGENLAALYTSTHVERVRGGIEVIDELGGLNVFLGTNRKVYMVSNSNLVTNVTPSNFVVQSAGEASLTGYGLFRYGRLAYGTPRPAGQGRTKMAFAWGFSTWGREVIAVARGFNENNIYKKSATDTTLVPVTGAPFGVNDAFVTDERFLMTLGDPDNDRMVRWSNQEDYTEWTPAVTNQAGFLQLSGVGRLVRGFVVASQILILGDNDAFAGQYIGPPYVYSFPRIGEKCGIVGYQAVAKTRDIAVWLSASGFWMFDGQVRELPCEVWDFYLADHVPEQRSKTYGFTISAFNEMWFLYQSRTSELGDCDSYIIYNYALNIWYTGRLSRTFGLDADPLRYILMVGPGGVLWDHDVRSASRGTNAWLETGPIEAEDGRRLLGFSWIYPDESLEGSIRLEVRGRDLPNLPMRFIREFELSSPLSTTGVMARDLRLRFIGTGEANDWALGDFRVVPIGRAPRR